MKRKICVVITARPSYSRIKSALDAIQKSNDLELFLVLAASALLDRYGSVSNTIRNDGFHVNEEVYMSFSDDTNSSMARSTGIGIIELSSVFKRIKPHIVVTIADRYETMATAIAASYQNIPLAHIQGGEKTGNIDEKVRHAITKLSDIHLVSSDDAYNRLIKMGEDPNFVFVTGCPSIDIARGVNPNSIIHKELFNKYSGVGHVLDLSKGYLVVLQHPVTTEKNESKFQIIETLEAVIELNKPTLMFWPNIDSGSDEISAVIRNYREKNRLNNIHLFKNIDPLDFLNLINNSLCLVGNSSVGIRESSFLGVPVVNIGSRQNGRLRGANVNDCSYSRKEILDAIKKQISHGKYKSEALYGNSFSGEKIAEVLSFVELKFDKIIQY
jgi:UDP-hydrolysing UDP-N-acetyl-D-glucosamine 2-epimerase